MSFYHIIYKFLSVEILSVFLKTQIKLGQVSGSYLNPPLLGMTLNKNVSIEKYWWRNYRWDFTQRGCAKD
jgi:hypothetical protein